MSEGWSCNFILNLFLVQIMKNTVLVLLIFTNLLQMSQRSNESFKWTLEGKRSSLISRRKLFLHQDYARQNIMWMIFRDLKLFQWETMSHSPYAPGIFPIWLSFILQSSKSFGRKKYNFCRQCQNSTVIFRHRQVNFGRRAL